MFQGFKKATPYGGARKLRLTQPPVRRVSVYNISKKLFHYQWYMGTGQTPDIYNLGFFCHLCPTFIWMTPLT